MKTWTTERWAARSHKHVLELLTEPDEIHEADEERMSLVANGPVPIGAMNTDPLTVRSDLDHQELAG